jgi:hypothetical protein
VSEGASFDVGAYLKLKLGEIADGISGQRKDLNKLANRVTTPVLSKAPISGIVPASGFLVIPGGGLMGPDMGHFWYVRSIKVCGTTPGTSVTGRADIFISAADYRYYTSLAQCSVGDWQDQTATIPNIAFYGRGEMPLRLNEQLFIVISGATSAQQIEGSVTFEDYEEGSANTPGFGGGY